MKIDEAKQIAYKKKPIYYEGVKFKKIVSLIFRFIDKDVIPYAEVQDINSETIYLLPVSKLDTKPNEYPINVNRQYTHIKDRVINIESNMNDLIKNILHENVDKSTEYIYSTVEQLFKLDEEIQEYIKKQSEDNKTV